MALEPTSTTEATQFPPSGLTLQDVFNSLDQAHARLGTLKHEAKTSDVARHYAIIITDLEKVMAEFAYWIYNPSLPPTDGPIETPHNP